MSDTHLQPTNFKFEGWVLNFTGSGSSPAQAAQSIFSDALDSLNSVDAPEPDLEFDRLEKKLEVGSALKELTSAVASLKRRLIEAGCHEISTHETGTDEITESQMRAVEGAAGACTRESLEHLLRWEPVPSVE